MRKTLFIAFLAFAFPVVAVLAMNWEQIQEGLKIEAKTARGKVLFFTAPNR